MQTLFRGNSLASKIMAYCFKFYGLSYLRELLNPLIMEMFQKEHTCQQISFEVDPARYTLTFSFIYIICIFYTYNFHLVTA